MSKIFVSIVNYNGEKDTLECLKSLENIDVSGFELSAVVIDNASNKSFKVEEGVYKNFKLSIINSMVNLGFSGGHNLGIKKALSEGADYVLILNNDVILDKDLLKELLKTFVQKPACGIVSPKIYFAKGHEFHKARYEEKDLGKVIWYAGGEVDWKNVLALHKGVDEVDNGQFDKLLETAFASGCCMLIKKEVFEKIGFFDEKYFLYYEDNDFSQRAKANGFLVFFQPKAFMWHINAGSTGGSGSSLQDYYITRNRLVFGFTYAPLRAKLAIFRESLMQLYSGRKWQKKGVTDYYLHNFGKGSFK